MKYMMAIDQGTTGTTAMLFGLGKNGASNSKHLEALASANHEFPQYYPQEGWVEHDLDEIWSSTTAAIADCLASAKSKVSGFSADQVSSLGITNQRETLTVFDAKSSRPVSKAIVWQCKRSQKICEAMKTKDLELKFREKTGLLLDPYFTGTKLKWLFDNQPETAEKIMDGSYCFGTVDTYLLHRLTAGSVWATEPSNASRTLCYNLHKRGWDRELISMLGLPEGLPLPEIKDSNALFGYTKGLGTLPDGIPISGILGDQQSALFGQRCFEVGEAKCTYGTGAFLLVQTGEESLSVADSQGLLSTVAWRIKNETVHALEGAAFTCGASVQFIRDQLKLIGSAQESEDLARGVDAAPYVYFVPALAGLGAPYWNPNARGAFLGMSRGTTREVCIRAVLEGMALQVQDLALAMVDRLGEENPIKSFKVDGGAAANKTLMEFQAALLNLPIVKPEILETTAMGAALISGLGSGIFESLEEIKQLSIHSKIFEPNILDAKARMMIRKGWAKANEAVRVFSEVNE